MTNTVYIFIKKSNVTTAMLNRSTSCCMEETPTYIVQNPWYLFFTNDEFTVLKIKESELVVTTIFDNYQWYDYDNAKIKIAEFEANQL